MRQIKIADTTLSNAALSFREKIELVKYLERLGVSVIETGNIPDNMAESLFVKSIASFVKDSIIAVPAGLDSKTIEKTWDSLKEAEKPRLQVCVPLSTSQMEYIIHKKSNTIVQVINDAVSQCTEYCKDVEFVAQDATRTDVSLLCDCLNAAISAGAKTVTVCDDAGSMLFDEYSTFIDTIKEKVNMNGVCLAVSCSNEIGLASACSVAAVNRGASELKVCCCGNKGTELGIISKIFAAKLNMINADISLRRTEINKILNNIENLFNEKNTIINSSQKSISDIAFTKNESIEEIEKHINLLGYELSDYDLSKVYSAFLKVAEKKSSVNIGELEAIIASESMQVEQTYSLESYAVTCSNSIDTVSHVKLKKGDSLLDGLAIGDGPIDASFRAIEKITGYHYELDDFQIQSITQEREAMGQSIVKLRSNGKVFSGRGVSTDIVGSGISAYISALNKIVWEDTK